MEPSWIKEFTRTNISKDILKSEYLETNQINYIDEKFIQFYELSESDIQNAINDYSFEKGYLILEVLLLKRQIIELKAICSNVLDGLEIPNRKWDWSHYGTSFEDRFYYKLRLLRILLENYKNDIDFLQSIMVLSYHSHPQLPWSSKLNSTLVWNIVHVPSVNDKIHPWIDKYINEKLRPQLLVIRNRSLTQHGRLKANKNNLRPKLGYSNSINDETSEEDARRNWKSSPKTKSLAMVWFLIGILGDYPWFNNNWTILTSFILNLLEDHEVVFKAHACILLESLVTKLKDQKKDILQKSGLLELFIKTTKPCLSYLPNLTSNDESVSILSKAYAALFVMLDDNMAFIDLLNTTLSSIAHLKSNKSAIPTLIILLNQLILIIKRLDYNVLISFSRINFAINQLLVDPSIIEESIQPAKLALDAQFTILQIFYNLSDPESIALVFAYRFDFIASWVILNDRISDESVTTIIRTNYGLLKQFSQTLDMWQELHNDIEKINAIEPMTNTLFT